MTTTGQPVWLGVGDIADRLGLKRETIYVYSTRGKLPPPDMTTSNGRTKLWLSTTIDRWEMERPKRGGTS